MTGEALTVRVTHRYRATAERVFDAFLDIDKARKFMFATKTGEIVRAEVDPRVGGKFLFVDRRPEGDAEHFGEFVEINRPHRLVFLFSSDGVNYDRITIDIAARGTGCELTLTHEMKPEFAEYRDRVIEGWTGILAGLEEALG